MRHTRTHTGPHVNGRGRASFAVLVALVALVETGYGVSIDKTRFTAAHTARISRIKRTSTVVRERRVHQTAAPPNTSPRSLISGRIVSRSVRVAPDDLVATR